MGNTSKQDAIVQAAMERDAQALNLRIAGATWQQISDKLGYGSEGNARRAIKRVRDRSIAETAETHSEYVEEQWARLERLHLAWWPKMQTPQGAAVLLRIYERQSALRGLDAPKKTELTGKDGGPIKYEDVKNAILARIALIAAASGAGEPPRDPDAGGSGGAGA